MCNQNSKKNEKCIFITLLKDRAQKHARGHSKKTGILVDVEEYAIRCETKENKSESLACPIESCGKIIAKLRLNNHKLTKHKLCPWCEDLHEYQSFEEIKTHCQKKHKSKNLFFCHTCKSFINVDKTKFTHHQTICDGPKIMKPKRQVQKKVSATKGKFKCRAQDCDEAYAQKCGLDHHMVYEHHMCPECGFKAEGTNREALEKVAIHLLTATASNNPGHGSKYARRAVYVCNQCDLKQRNTDCLYIGLKSDEAQRHAQKHSKNLDAKPYEIPEEVYIETETLTCPFTQNCERAQSAKPFQRRAKLIEHIVRSHVECPFGESFGCCQIWDEEKELVAKDYGIKSKTSNQGIYAELKPKLRFALEKHVLSHHKGLCKYIKACTCCENTISTDKGDFQRHSCSAKKRPKLTKLNTKNNKQKKRELIFDEQSSDASECCQNGDDTNLEYEIYSEDEADHSLGSSSKLKDWKCEIPELGDDTVVAVVHGDIDFYENIDTTDSESSAEDDIFLSCWMKKWEADPEASKTNKIKLQKKYCSTSLESEAAIVEHFQSMHNSCFECMKNKAFFSTVEDLTEHEKSLHQGEVPRKSKCLTYGNQKVCLLCVIKHCQHKSAEDLELHMNRGKH